MTTTSTPVNNPNSDNADRKNYDLEDNVEDFAKWPKLRNFMLASSEVLVPIYKSADAAAIRTQNRFGWLVLVSAICGTLAVLCAILELAEVIPLSPSTISIVELIAAGLALVAVGIGIYSAMHRDWLLHRFMAEQCRFIKFHLLLNPSSWHGRSAGELQAILKESYSKLENTKGEQLIHDWATWRVQIAGRFDASPVEISNDVLKELTDYYQAKRLEYQRKYFQDQAHRRHRWEWSTKYISPVCFFLSIVAALTHFLLERLAGEDHHGQLAWWARLCVVLAAALPVIAMGVRTFRAAHEFGRNKLRFEGMAFFLSEIEVLAKGQQSPQSLLQLLREAEIALDSEHRAWLRLMLEAEWFG